MKKLHKPKRGNKNDKGKPPLALIPPAALRETAKAFMGRDSNIELWNYKYGIEVTRTVSGAMRHISDFMDGVDIDAGSGAHSLGCAIANLSMCLDTLTHYPELDNRFKRPKKGKK
jgi:Domain of unknown function (DUF5664)